MGTIKYIVKIDSVRANSILLYKKEGYSAVYRIINKEEFFKYRRIIYMDTQWDYSFSNWEKLISAVKKNKAIAIYSNIYSFIN